MAQTKVTDDVRDVTEVDAAKITTGTIPEARITTLDATKLTGTVNNARISLDAAEIPDISTDKLTSGTIPDARLPSTALNSNVDLTTLSASNLTSGTLPDARFPATLPAASGVNLTALNATNLGSGTASVARGGTGAATHTANNVLVGNGTSAIASVAPSTSGNLLTSNGSAWTSAAAAGGGAWNFIHTATASGSSSLEFKHGTGGVVLDSTYSVYIFMLKNILLAATTGGDLQMQISTDAGSSWTFSGGKYYSYTYGLDVLGAARASSIENGTYFSLTDGQYAETQYGGICGQVELFDPSNASVWPVANWQLAAHSSVGTGYPVIQNGCGVLYEQTDIDGVKFYASGGENIESGEIRLYGLADS